MHFVHVEVGYLVNTQNNLIHVGHKRISFDHELICNEGVGVIGLYQVHVYNKS